MDKLFVLLAVIVLAIASIVIRVALFHMLVELLMKYSTRFRRGVKDHTHILIPLII